MSKFKYEKEFMFNERKAEEVRLFLKDKQSLDISQIRDDKFNTVLHQASYQGSLSVLKQYIHFMKRYWKNQDKNKNDINSILKNWVNQKNKEGFSCLHYAAYKGQIQILSYLDELEADCNIKTNSGLGALHLASQSDKVKTFIFYRSKIDINIPDEKLSTPLHWAAYNGSERVTEYLLSQQNIKLNSKDSDGQTPLHLATSYGNTKIVRKLLIAGAERHIKNKQNQQPIQIAKENQFHSIQNFLNDHYKCIDYIKFFLNVKIKYEPKKRSFKMPILFFFLSLILIAAISLGLKYHEQYIAIFYVQEGLFLILQGLYLSLIVGPKRVKKGTYESIINGVSKRLKQNTHYKDTIISSNLSNQSEVHPQIDSVCLRCVQYKPMRSYHCDYCNTCIELYDHHCPWINNCVGKNNIKRFVLFLFLLFIVLNWILMISIQFILVIVHDEDDRVAFFEINDWLSNNQAIMYIFVSITTFIYLFFMFPLLVLICVQVYNLLLGKTTYERFSKANQSILSKIQKDFTSSNSGLLQRKQNKVSCFNCVAICYPTGQQTRKLLQ